MDDQQGNVIDGTARARQWRLVRSKTPSASDRGEARSDAPKSIAGSLLVPADMLPSVVPDDQADGDAVCAVPSLSPPCQVASNPPPTRGAPDQNPFLVPEAASTENAKIAARTRLWRVVGSFTGTPPRFGLRRHHRHDRQRLTRGWARARRRQLRWAASAVAGTALLATGAAVVLEGVAWTGHPVTTAHQGGAIATASGPETALDSAAEQKAATLTRRDRQASERTATRRAAKRQRQRRHGTRRHPPSARSQPAAAGGDGASPVGAEATATSTGSSTRSSASTAETTRPVTIAPASTTTPAPLPPGPSGPGGTVGSNCNPKCS
jgi:hypothetical protein